MKLIIKPRQSGKTTELCELAQDLDMFDYFVWVVAPYNNVRYIIEEKLCKKVDLSKIRIYDACEVVQMFNCEHPKYILCDEWFYIKRKYRNQLIKNYDDKIIAWGTPLLGSIDFGPK